MKKLLYLLLLLPFSFITSCDKEEVAPFDMTLTMSGVSMADNTFYTVAGDNVSIDNLEVKSLGGTTTEVANVVYFLDGMALIGDPGFPFDGNFSTANIPAGRHTIGVSGYLLQEDHSLKNFAVNYPLVIVDNEEDLPSGAQELGTYSLTISFTNAD